MNNQKLTDRVYDEILNREPRTVAQLARDMFPEEVREDGPHRAEARIRGAISSLRRNRGVMVFPIPDGSAPGAGKVRIVEDDEGAFLGVVNRQMGGHTEPSLLRSFEYAERLAEAHPRLRKKVEKMARGLLQTAHDTGNNILGIEYEPRRLPKNRNRPDKPGS